MPEPDLPAPLRLPGGGGGGNGCDEDDDACWMEHAGSGGDDDCGVDEICIDLDTRDICDYDNCPSLTTLTGIMGTAADALALYINLPFGIAAGLAILATRLGIPVGPFGYAAVVAAYNSGPGLLSNAFGWVGFGFWAGQGFITGESHLSLGITLSSDLQLREARLSGSLAQDTVWSGLNDTLALSLKEPMVATIWSAVGAIYDVTRNPLAPSLSSAPPAFPTVIQPSFSIVYNESGSSTANFSLFP